jgi:hypothetical protein
MAWQDEDHVCHECGLSYRELSIDRGIEVVRSVPAAAGAAVAAIPAEMHGRRPGPAFWSVSEYVCHLRDVYVAYTIRLHRARTEDGPSVEPMLNDLRARRFRYRERDPGPVLDELAVTAAGFCEEASRMRPEDWDRVVRRLPGEERTARWLLRQAAHEGLHHVRDIERLSSDASMTAVRNGDGPAGQWLLSRSAGPP